MKVLFPKLLVALALTGCAKSSGPKLSLIGSWKLVDRQCRGCPTSTPDETITFTATGFTFYENGHFVADGTYADMTASLCGGPTTTPVVRFTYRSLKLRPFNAAAATLANTLMLDYGGECDAPIDIYRRRP